MKSHELGAWVHIFERHYTNEANGKIKGFTCLNVIPKLGNLEDGIEVRAQPIFLLFLKFWMQTFPSQPSPKLSQKIG
jgi:hypothetical protein